MKITKNSEFKKSSNRKSEKIRIYGRKNGRKNGGLLMAKRKVQIRPVSLLAKAIKQKLQPEKIKRKRS